MVQKQPRSISSFSANAQQIVCDGQTDTTAADRNIIETRNWSGIDVNGPVTVLNNSANVISNNILNMVDQGDPPLYPGNGNPGIPYFGGTSCPGIGIKSTGQWWPDNRST